MLCKSLCRVAYVSTYCFSHSPRLGWWIFEQWTTPMLSTLNRRQSNMKHRTVISSALMTSIRETSVNSNIKPDRKMCTLDESLLALHWVIVLKAKELHLALAATRRWNESNQHAVMFPTPLSRDVLRKLSFWQQICSSPFKWPKSSLPCSQHSAFRHTRELDKSNPLSYTQSVTNSMKKSHSWKANRF
jgi:hypothetical protein